VSAKRTWYCEWEQDGGHKTIGFRMADGSLQLYVDVSKLHVNAPGEVVRFPRAERVTKTGS
jgi:hypothetical protein